MEPLATLAFVVLQKVTLLAYPVHGNGESVIAESAAVARTVKSAAKTEKQRGATMLLRIVRNKCGGI
jgi:hypothetical protein